MRTLSTRISVAHIVKLMRTRQRQRAFSTNTLGEHLRRTGLGRRRLRSLPANRLRQTGRTREAA